MFDLNSHLRDLVSQCQASFGDRLWHVGLQAAVCAKKAHEDSDIDVTVIPDRFSAEDTDLYRETLKQIGFYEKSCGFTCGKEKKETPESPGGLPIAPYDEGFVLAY